MALTKKVGHGLLRDVSGWISKRGRRFFFVSVVAVFLSFTGCWKKSGAAVVIGKDYVPAQVISEMPDESPIDRPGKEGASPVEQAPTSSERMVTTDTAEKEEEVLDDMIGPPMDPRATSNEQWIVSVRMIESGRQIDVRMDQPQWEKLKIDDRVHVTYREGKYTHTVWGAAID